MFIVILIANIFYFIQDQYVIDSHLYKMYICIVKNIAFLTSGGIAPCLSSCIVRLMFQYKKKFDNVNFVIFILSSFLIIVNIL